MVILYRSIKNKIFDKNYYLCYRFIRTFKNGQYSAILATWGGFKRVVVAKKKEKAMTGIIILGQDQNLAKKLIVRTEDVKTDLLRLDLHRREISREELWETQLSLAKEEGKKGGELFQ